MSVQNIDCKVIFCQHYLVPLNKRKKLASTMECFTPVELIFQCKIEPDLFLSTSQQRVLYYLFVLRHRPQAIHSMLDATTTPFLNKASCFNHTRGGHFCRAKLDVLAKMTASDDELKQKR